LSDNHTKTKGGVKMKYDFLETMKQATKAQMNVLTDGYTKEELRGVVSNFAKKVADQAVESLTNEAVAESFQKLVKEQEDNRWESREIYPCPFDGYTTSNKLGNRIYTIDYNVVMADNGECGLERINKSLDLRYDFKNGNAIEVWKNRRWITDADDVTNAMKRALWKQAFLLAMQYRSA
jgi:hypothetical protein